MRFVISVLLIAAIALNLPAQNTNQLKQPIGYSIKATIKPFKSGYLFLAYHFGTKQFLIDSSKINSEGQAIFTGKTKLLGGVYMIVFPEKNGWIECLLDQQQHFSVTADTSNIVKSIVFSGSSDNTVFNDYQKKSFEIGAQLNQLKKSLNEQKDDADKKNINDQMTSLSKEIQVYREDIQKNHPKLLLTAIFNLLKDPTIPPVSQHPGGVYDTTFAYQYYKNHYWDGISFTDDRLIRTPVLQGKFDKYYDEVLPQIPDSINTYADKMLTASNSNEEMFKFFLSSLAEKYVNPKFMGQDAVFVHLFEKYFLTGKADAWMNEKYKKYIFDRGYSMMSNLLGMKAAELPMIDTLGKNFSLYDVKAPYTVLCFWDPTCGHCQQEVPKVDSIFQKKWKGEGIKLIGIMTDGGKENWLKYIREHKLAGWQHIYQTDETKDAIYKANKAGYRQLYDIYQTPMIYLLDKDKNILAKKLTYLQVDDLIEFKKKSAK
jgi:thiol-disulfide isomerase/thioredoxin